MENMDMMFRYLALFLLLYVGVTSLMGYIKLRRERVLFPSKTLYPANCSEDNCLDPDGFIEYILPRLLVMSIGCLLGVAFELLTMFVLTVPDTAIYVMFGLEFVMIVWLMIVYHRAAKRFW